MNKRYIWGAIAAAAVVVVVLVVISFAGGSDEKTVSSITGVDAVKTQLAGIPQKGSTMGEADAPVEIVEYGDTSCPVCRQSSEVVIPDLIDQYVRTGEAKMTFRPVAFISASSERGALGGEAAAMQDAMWPFITLIYANQGDEATDWLTDPLLKEAVTELGLDTAKWEEDYAGEAVASSFFEADAAWKAAGGTGTPTFVITGPRGTKTFTSAQGIAAFQQAIKEVGPA